MTSCVSSQLQESQRRIEVHHEICSQGEYTVGCIDTAGTSDVGGGEGMEKVEELES